LRIFAGARGVGPVIGLIVAVWMLAAMVVAVRQALDYRGTGRAVAVCLVGFLIYLGVLIALAVALGLGAWMLGSAAGRLAP
jgi:hypothetical protein